MSRRISEARRSRDGGFTLVELLVVVVILGVLSAVVVFSVRGSGDKGEQAAIGTDARTLRTAQEVHCAQFGRYADMAELVDKRLLSEPSTYHDTSPTPDGSCTASGDLDRSGFTITCTEPDKPGCQAVVPPPPEPGDFSQPKSLTLPVGEGERSVLLTGAGCEPYCGHVVRVVNVSDLGIYSAERYDPTADAWTLLTGFSTGEFSQFGTMALLNGANCGANCGKILLHADGSGGAGWWLYDPDLNLWTKIASGIWPRNHATSLTLLGGSSCSPHCGKVLAASGESSWPQGPDYTDAQVTAELFDPSTGSWSLTASLNNARAGHLAAALPDGSVLVVSGETFNSDRNSLVERYFPGVGGGTGEWRRVPPYDHLALDRRGRAAVEQELVLLNDGRLLFTGEGIAEVYDPASNGGLGAWTDASGCGGCGQQHTSTLLQNGLVLLTGGFRTETSTQLYNPATNAWSAADTMAIGRFGHSAIRLLDGKVLVTGGDATGESATYEIYAPA